MNVPAKALHTVKYLKLQPFLMMALNASDVKVVGKIYEKYDRCLCTPSKGHIIPKK